MKFLRVLALGAIMATSAFGLELKDLFTNGTNKYTGGFESAGSEITTMIEKTNSKGNIVVREITKDTGATKTAVYEIEPKAVRMVYQKEGEHKGNYTKNKDHVILQAPLKKGTKWTSHNAFEIIAADAHSVTVKETIKESGATITYTYEHGIGLTNKLYKDGDFVVENKIIKEKK